MSRQCRTRLTRNIYRDSYGIAAVARAKGLRRELRFPADEPLDRVQAALERARAQLREDAAANVVRDATRHTLTEAVSGYLSLRAGRPGAAADRSHLNAWLALYPNESPTRLSPSHVERAIAAWRVDGTAPQTIRHRCRALRQLLGARAARVFEGVYIPRPSRPSPRAIPVTVVQRVARELEHGDPATYARFLVRWTTGQRPVDVMRAEPADVDLEARIWWVRSSKGGQPHQLALTEGGLRAWRLFVKADAWGTFSTTQHARELRRAGWPDGVRPYELRHTLAIQVLQQGGDLGDVQAALGHRSIETTRVFYGAVQLERAQRVAAKLGELQRW